MTAVGRLLGLRPGELGRVLPFSALYLLLFGALSLGDGIALALVATRVGPGGLPAVYAVTAAVNVALVGGYVRVAERVGAGPVFGLIVGGAAGLFGMAWVAGGGGGWPAALFVTREAASTLALLHFGTYLQGYFTRDELSRVLPAAYAGGRVGGIAGGWVLERVGGGAGPAAAIPAFVGVCAACLLVTAGVSARATPAHAPEDDRGDPGTTGDGADEAAARASACGFVRFAWASPLLFWTTAASTLFMAARWFLSYRYTEFFAARFPDPAALAGFLGRYTQIALVGAVLVQLLVVNRLVARFGVGGAYLGYAGLVAAAAGLAAGPMTLGTAVACRVLETELRFGLRNPLMQLVTNKFAKPVRVRVRAWTLGLLTPVGTVAASAGIGALLWAGGPAAVGWGGAAVGLAHLLAAGGLRRADRAG